MRNGRAYQQVLWEPATKEIGGGLLPTPRAQEPGSTSHTHGDSVMERVCLQIGVPTKKYPSTLPTPKASDALRGRDVARSRPDDKARELATVLRDQMLPSPTTNDSKNTTLPPSQIERDGLAGAMLRDPSIPTGGAMCLNPSFLEEMMGFPIGWTASTP